MQKLPNNLRKKGFEYQRVFRCFSVAIYAQIEDGKTVAYEVFEIKVRKGRELFGKWYETREVFPNNEAFGKWAWSVKTLESALQKVERLHLRITTRKIKKKSIF